MPSWSSQPEIWGHGDSRVCEAMGVLPRGPWRRAPGKGVRESFPGRPTRRDEDRAAELRPGAQDGHSRRKRGQYLGTTVVLSGPRTQWQRAAEVEQPPQGLERRGQPASLLLGRVSGPAHASLPSPFLRAVRGAGQPAAALSSPPPGGSRARGSQPRRKHQSPAPQPDPLAEGAGEPRREAASAIGSPFHPAGQWSPNHQEAPHVCAGLS